MSRELSVCGAPSAGREFLGFYREAWRDEPGGEGTLATLKPKHCRDVELFNGDAAQGL
jgi:hypothetical protein